MASLSSSRRFWDRKAQENAYWYVSSYVDYNQPDVGSFWRSGVSIWREIKQHTGYGPAPDDTVVEIGCGVGRLTRPISGEVGTVHAFDISPEMLAKAANDAPGNVRFHLTVGNSFPQVPSNSADLVLAYLVFQHLPSEQVYAQCLREMARMTKPGGKMVFTTSPRDWKAFCLPLLRARTYLTALVAGQQPTELYRHEWTGIRPSPARTRTLCPVPLAMTVLPGRRWLYLGNK